MICDKCGFTVDDDEMRGLDSTPCCDGQPVEGGCREVAVEDRTARREHRDGNNVIPVGAEYRAIVFRHWRKGGPSWFTVTRFYYPHATPPRGV